MSSLKFNKVLYKQMFASNIFNNLNNDKERYRNLSESKAEGRKHYSNKKNSDNFSTLTKKDSNKRITTGKKYSSSKNQITDTLNQKQYTITVNKRNIQTSLKNKSQINLDEKCKDYIVKRHPYKSDYSQDKYIKHESAHEKKMKEFYDPNYSDKFNKIKYAPTTKPNDRINITPAPGKTKAILRKLNLTNIKDKENFKGPLLKVRLYQSNIFCDKDKDTFNDTNLSYRTINPSHHKKSSFVDTHPVIKSKKRKTNIWSGKMDTWDAKNEVLYHKEDDLYYPFQSNENENNLNVSTDTVPKTIKNLKKNKIQIIKKIGLLTENKQTNGLQKNKHLKKMDINPNSRKFLSNYSRIFDSNNEKKDIRNKILVNSNNKLITKCSNDNIINASMTSFDIRNFMKKKLGQITNEAKARKIKQNLTSEQGRDFLQYSYISPEKNKTVNFENMNENKFVINDVDKYSEKDIKKVFNENGIQIYDVQHKVNHFGEDKETIEFKIRKSNENDLSSKLDKINVTLKNKTGKVCSQIVNNAHKKLNDPSKMFNYTNKVIIKKKPKYDPKFIQSYMINHSYKRHSDFQYLNKFKK